MIYGGNRSVIWTDVAQMALVWFGIFTCVGVAISQLPAAVSLRDALALAQAAGRLEMMDTSLDLARPYTLWSGLIGGMFLAMAYFGCDQSQVQRYLSGRSLTREPPVAAVQRGLLKVPMQFLILLTGVLVFVFFHFHETPLLWNRRRARAARAAGAAGRARARRGPGPGGARRAAERGARLRARAPRGRGRRRGAGRLHRRAAPRRRGRGGRRGSSRPRSPAGRSTTSTTSSRATSSSRLRGGLAGLILAVIFAAAMSALAGELNSLATATMVDFYAALRARGRRPRARPAGLAPRSRRFWGFFAALVALQAGELGSAIEVVNRFGSYFYGSILGVFGLAVLTPAGQRARRLLRRSSPGWPPSRWSLAHPARVPLVQRRGAP